MISRGVRSLGKTAGSLILVIASMLLTVSAASADIAVVPGLQGQDQCLGNGQFVRPGNRTGRGALTINNGLDRDAVITLAIANRPVYSVSVCKSAEYKVRGIRDGTYEVFFTTGMNWDSQNRAFTGDPTFQRFDDTLTFATTRTANEIRWNTWTITLHGVPGGTANASVVNPDDYPKP